MYCPRCGAKAADTARFCPKCGQALTAPVSVPRPAPTPPPVSQSLAGKASKNRKDAKNGSRMVSLLPVLALLLALGAAVLVCGNARSRTAPDEALLEDSHVSASELMAEGNAAYSREDYELALEFYLRAIELFPDEGDARSRAGDACFRLDREEEALGHYQAALMLYGDGTLPLQSAQNYYHLTEDKEGGA